MKKKKQNAENSLQNDITQLEDKIRELTCGWQRTQADFENFRRKTDEEKIRISRYASAKVIEEILPVLDNFDRALMHKPKDLEKNEYITGLEYIKIQLEQVLKSYGLRKLDAKAKDTFDPKIHEAIESVSKEGFKTDEITEVIEDGYFIDDALIRPAKVKVAR